MTDFSFKVRVSIELLKTLVFEGLVVSGILRLDLSAVFLLDNVPPDYCSITISEVCKQSRIFKLNIF